MKAPLAVYVLYHSENKEGHEIYEQLYKLLCRNADDPFFDGLDIPVYFSKGSDSQDINAVDYTRAEKTVVLLLLDQKMYISEAWRNMVKDIPNTSNVWLCPISQYQYAFDFSSRTEYQQFISLKSYSVLDNWQEFKTRLFDYLIRSLSLDPKKKLKIFISHSKRDKDNLGRVNAENLRDYLRKETKGDSFYDVNDIVDGFRFDKQIESAIKDSLLIVLFTNTYSSREWCRRELLTAKKYQIPAIAVFMVNGDIDRVFPYIGNIPSTIYDGDWRPVLNLLFRTALDQYHELLLLDRLSDEGTSVLPFSPEAFSLSIVDVAKKKVLYPEPPLGPEEIEILQAIRPDTKFYTPMQYLAKDVDLKGKKVAISVSESDNFESLGLSQAILKDLTVELSRHILIAKGRMVYGGDLRQEGYTELFKDLSYQYGQFEKTDSSHVYFDNYLAWPITTKLTEDIVADYAHNRVNLVKVEHAVECEGVVNLTEFLPPVGDSNLYLWGQSLTRMRETMEASVSARIIVGGRTRGFKGKMAGLLEEFKIAKDNHHPIYLVGGFGGIAGLLCATIRKEIPSNTFLEEACKHDYYESLLKYYASKGQPIDYSWIDNLTEYDLNNGLTPDENKRLFSTTNIMEIVSLVLHGLSKQLRDA
jgi:hypothetical protein